MYVYVTAFCLFVRTLLIFCFPRLAYPLILLDACSDHGRYCLGTLAAAACAVDRVPFSNHRKGESVTLKGHTGGVRSVHFSRDGRRLLTGSDDKTAKVNNNSRNSTNNNSNSCSDTNRNSAVELLNEL